MKEFVSRHRGLIKNYLEYTNSDKSVAIAMIRKQILDLCREEVQGAKKSSDRALMFLIERDYKSI